MLFVKIFCLSTLLVCDLVSSSSVCYGENKEARQCLTPYENIAFGKSVEVTNTCGSLGQEEEYCLLSGSFGSDRTCLMCNEKGEKDVQHDSKFLTDAHQTFNPTWWQSQTLFEKGMDTETIVNLTLDFHKSFDISIVRLTFQSPRPSAFTIYKKKCNLCNWEPFQYFSSYCLNRLGIEAQSWLSGGLSADDEVACVQRYSGLSPLTGGIVSFSTLEGRPGSWRFDESKVLQDWITASAIRISLYRMNTLGDETFGEEKVLKSYYYALSDISIQGRCKCNGHGSKCETNEDGRLICICEHNTKGDDCDMCSDLYNDAPWKRATQDSANECQKCDCNGFSETCIFDDELYQRTGHGGRCVECMENTAGQHCELCLSNHYRISPTEGCATCDCHETGSISGQCDDEGVCSCKDGVGGDKCDQCMSGYFGLAETGCRKCQSCSDCDPVSGDCPKYRVGHTTKEYEEQMELLEESILTNEISP